MPHDTLLNPGSIAVYGASPSETSPGAHIFRNLIGQGFDGKITPINPKYPEVSSQPCFPSQAVAGTRADLAVIAIPRASVTTALQDCANVGTKSAIVITAGFDSGQGPSSVSRLVKTAEQGGITMMGPNCLGLIRPHLRLNATFQPTLPAFGGLALISQSGAVCSALADMAADQGIGFSAMMSLGNSVQFGLPEALYAATSDPMTRAILVYVEGVRRGDVFRAALTHACSQKSVIVLKAGRHAAGADAAATHTGALVGSDRVFTSVLESAGAIQVQTLGALLQTARLLESAQISGNRLAIVTNGGGAGVLTADRLSDRSLPIAPLPSDVVATLDKFLSPNWSRQNPLDIVGDASPDHYRAAIDACLESDAFDAALTLLSPQSMTAPSAVADVVLAAHHRHEKPILTCFLGGATVASAQAKLRSQRIADFDLPEDAIRAFHCAVRAHLAARSPSDTRQLPAVKTNRTNQILTCLPQIQPGMMSDTASRKLLSQAGIPCPVPEFATSADEAVTIATALKSAVVLKINSPDISHKSEVDGVRLNLQTEAEIRDAFDGIEQRMGQVRPDARFDGVTVEPFVSFSDARELLIGVTRDPVFGPVVTFGAGGTLVEFLDDVATAVLPLTEDSAKQLIASTRVSKILGAFRNMKAVQIDALVATLLAVSDLCQALPDLEEMDINPLIASPQGLCAVDARIRFGGHDLPLLSK
ncbi:MAG: acetate--CoA ligase family protein [Pseudomonadota bacterium]